MYTNRADNKFQVGDFITGTKNSDDCYGITNSEAIMIVESVRGDGMRVRIINHNHSPNLIQKVYTVMNSSDLFQYSEGDKDKYVTSFSKNIDKLYQSIQNN